MNRRLFGKAIGHAMTETFRKGSVRFKILTNDLFFDPFGSYAMEMTSSLGHDACS